MEERGRRSQLNRRSTGRRMGVGLAPSKLKPRGRGGCICVFKRSPQQLCKASSLGAGGRGGCWLPAECGTLIEDRNLWLGISKRKQVSSSRFGPHSLLGSTSPKLKKKIFFPGQGYCCAFPFCFPRDTNIYLQRKISVFPRNLEG